MSGREKRIIKDINHKISSSIVKYAVDNNCNINLENLSIIRQTAKKIEKIRMFLIS
jgi:IS605 OrfB family transposase